jgi:hypothetical protein
MNVQNGVWLKMYEEKSESKHASLCVQAIYARGDQIDFDVAMTMF